MKPIDRDQIQRDAIVEAKRALESLSAWNPDDWRGFLAAAKLALARLLYQSNLADHPSPIRQEKPNKEKDKAEVRQIIETWQRRTRSWTD